MSIKVKCPGCTKTLTVPDAARGKAVKCPSCETRVSVPADDGGAGATSSTPKTKKPAKKVGPVEDESGLASLDLRRVADKEANVCPKCGYDLDLASDDDEEVTECPQCGWDVAEGGMGAKARKRALKGPDPDKFYAGLWKNSWNFVGINLMLVIRTFLYLQLASVISLVATLGWLYVSQWPPRYFFFGPSAVVAFLVIPGWLWYLDTEVIKLTLERRDRFKRLNFDFFLAGALGVKFVLWNLAVAGPILAIPAIIGFSLWYFMSLPLWVPIVILAVCYIPIIGLYPVALTHMTMPIQWPGWQFWKVVPQSLRNFKATFTWFMYFTATHFAILLIGALTLFFTASDLIDYVGLMEQNKVIHQAQARWDEFSNAKKKPENLVDPKSLGELRKVEARHYIAIAVTEFAWIVSCVILSVVSLFNMRTNGYFSYYFRESLDLQLLQKEYKYVASLPRDNEKKIKTMGDVIAEAAVAVVVFILIGLIFGGLVGALNDQVGIPGGLVLGVGWGARFSAGAAAIGMLIAAFQVSPVWGLLIFFSGCMCGVPHIMFLIKEWEDAKQWFFQYLFSFLIFFLMIPVEILMGIGPIAQMIKEQQGGQNQRGPMQPGGPGDMAPPMPGGAPGAGAGPGGVTQPPAPITSPAGAPGAAGAPGPAGAPPAGAPPATPATPKPGG